MLLKISLYAQREHDSLSLKRARALLKQLCNYEKKIFFHSLASSQLRSTVTYDLRKYFERFYSPSEIGNF
jgi:hypothetical protein